MKIEKELGFGDFLVATGAIVIVVMPVLYFLGLCYISFFMNDSGVVGVAKNDPRIVSVVVAEMIIIGIGFGVIFGKNLSRTAGSLIAVFLVSICIAFIGPQAIITITTVVLVAPLVGFLCAIFGFLG